MKSVVIASDLGSSGCKTVAVDLDGGSVVASARCDYPTHRVASGWAEQDPDDWYRALLTSVRQVVSAPLVDPSAIAAFTIVGVTHTAVLVGSDGLPLAPAILMFDGRSAAEAEAIQFRWGDEVRRRTLNVATSVWTWPHLQWIRTNKPTMWAETKAIMFQKDYVRHRLVSGNVTDYVDAAGSLLFDPVESVWIEAFCDDLGLDTALLPSIVDPTALVGTISRAASEDLGIGAGTPVVAGTTDTAAEIIGAGAVRVGQGTIKLATVGRIAVVANSPVLDSHVLNYRHLLDDLWYPGTASKYAASAYRWLRGAVWSDLDDDDAYRIMDQAAATAPPGSDGLLFHPHLSGQWAPYWDKDLRASFLGITSRHGREHLTRAVLEGVAFSILDAFSDLESVDVIAQEIRLIGQGAVSPLWAQMMTDVIDRPLSVPTQVDAAYGGALVAAMGVGLLDSTPTAIGDFIRDRRLQYLPDDSRSRMYRELFEIYRQSVDQQRNLGRELGSFESRHTGEFA